MVLFKLPLRQTTGTVASLLRMADLNWAVTDHTTLCRRQKTLAVQIHYRRADGPLNCVLAAQEKSSSVTANGRHAIMVRTAVQKSATVAAG